MDFKFEIRDWANTLIKLDNQPEIFESFEDAEEALSISLDDNYETDRQEYYITALD